MIKEYFGQRRHKKEKKLQQYADSQEVFIETAQIMMQCERMIVVLLCLLPVAAISWYFTSPDSPYVINQREKTNYRQFEPNNDGTIFYTTKSKSGLDDIGKKLSADKFSMCHSYTSDYDKFSPIYMDFNKQSGETENKIAIVKYDKIRGAAF